MAGWSNIYLVFASYALNFSSIIFFNFNIPPDQLLIIWNPSIKIVTGNIATAYISIIQQSLSSRYTTEQYRTLHRQRKYKDHNDETIDNIAKFSPDPSKNGYFDHNHHMFEHTTMFRNGTYQAATFTHNMVEPRWYC